ncbi:MAG: UDP-N-acetylglucosamine 2-epimerase [Pseudomonadota bacterium]
MTQQRRISAVTTSRADFGPMASVLRVLKDDPDFDLSLIAARPGLLEDRDAALKDIHALSFIPDHVFDLGVDGDTPAAAAAALSNSTSEFARVFAVSTPDLILLPGDRYEMLGAASAALLSRIPVAHVFGGDITQGAIDDSVRHALTKLSHLHFCTNASAETRILQMGETPAHVFNVGSPALDSVAAFARMSREAVFKALGVAPRGRNYLVTHHPATLGDASPMEEIMELLGALEALGPDVSLVFTGVNIDPGHASPDRAIQVFVAKHSNAVYHASLGQKLYFNALFQLDAVIGNSSSGLYEAPSFKRPTINIGPRQDGRLRAASVIDCAAEKGAILEAVKRAETLDCSDVTNPYGDGRAAPRILEALKSIPDWSVLARKDFQTYPVVH